MNLFADNFNRADETPMVGNWTRQFAGGFNGTELVSNQVTITGSTNATSYVNSVVPNNDQWAECTINIGGTGVNAGGGPMVRMSTTEDSGYGLQIYGGTTLAIYKWEAGSYTGLGTVADLYISGGLYRLEVQGDELRSYKNGVLTLTVHDATFTSGRFGLYAYQNYLANGSAFDDFVGGDFLNPTADPVYGGIINYGVSTGPGLRQRLRGR